MQCSEMHMLALHLCVVCRLSTTAGKRRYNADQYQQLLSHPQHRVGKLQELSSVTPSYPYLVQLLREREWDAKSYEKTYEADIFAV
jgi:hypothetical protein